jgi:conjugative relaxase-like TrwC/TraI family protein
LNKKTGDKRHCPPGFWSMLARHFFTPFQPRLKLMFTAKPQKNRSAATQYFDEHLSHNDYYTQGETQAGYWIGQGAEHLGLKEGESVGRTEFLRLCDNQNPETGEKLTQLQLSERRIFFDFTCSAPKSVSILAVTMDDRRILDAHREASDIALKELEAFAGARVRKDGAMEDRTTGNLIGAAFRHTSSRALDPQLHTHFTLFNATHDPVEKQWKALQSSGMYDAIRYGTAVYRNELAKRLHGFGYATRQTAHGFEVAGVEPKIIERFSKRSKQRDQAVAREEKRLNRKLTKDEVSNVVHKSRPKKLKDASEDEVRGQQLDELGFFEKRGLKKLIAEANGVAWQPQSMEERVRLGPAVQYAEEHVFSRQSVAPEHALFEAALVKGCGQLELPEVKAAFRQNREFVRVGSEVSTKRILEAELKLLRTVNEGIGTVPQLAPRFEGPLHLSAGQRSALGHVFFAEDRITGFRGLAGTGKTTTLKEFGRVVAQVDHEAVFLAPTTGAVDVLRKDGFKGAMTLAKLLTDPEAQVKISEKSVLVLDEAGAVGTVDMQRLFDLAQNRGARVVLSGDTGQHAAVAQGDALRLIEEHSRYRYAVLGEIRRQTKETFRQAVKLAADQDTGAAFKLLQREGAVVEALTDQGRMGQRLYNQAAEAYLTATDAGKTALLVSPTWGEIAAVTEVLRERLKERGTISKKEETRQVFDSLGWTDAQKGLVTHYEPGLQVRFVRKTEQFKAGEIAEVADVSGRTVTLRAPGGKTVSWHPSRSPASFEVGEARELAVASGDWLLLQANAKAGTQTFTNGERVQVASVGRDGISLKDGRTLPPSYQTFNYGYAVTSHAAQGKTVDVGLFVASSRSFAAVSRESFYVGISRAKEKVTVFTDDAATLSRRVQDAHTRKAALELQGLREELAKNGLFRPREAERKKEAVKPVHRHEHGQRMSRALRALRVQRLAPVVAVQKWAQDFRRWMGEKIGAHVEQLTPSQRLQRTTRISAADQLRQRPDEPRQSQSRGYHM